MGDSTGTPSTDSGRAPSSSTSGGTQLAESPPLHNIVIEGTSSQELQRIDPAAGTSVYTITDNQIGVTAQGDDTPFNQILDHAPGVSNDTYGAIHFRNEDPYYRYYINGTLLPVGINGFNQEIDTRYVKSVTLKIGALSAYYPEGNYGIVDIQTKSGSDLAGGAASVYGGSYDTIHPSFSYGGSSGETDYYFTGSEVHDDLGLENPTPSASALHDETNQYRGFGYVSHSFGDPGKVSLIFSASDADYQIPDTPGQVTSLSAPPPPDIPTANSADLNERQNEQTYYGIVAYNVHFDELALQISEVNRYSSVLFNPDVPGDLYFNGVASRVQQSILTNGIQTDVSEPLGDSHFLSGGFLLETEAARESDTVEVFDVDPDTGDLSDAPPIDDSSDKRAYDYAVYVQDEWKPTQGLTLDYGLRFEQVVAYTDEWQASPRISAVYQFDEGTAVHAGYARYFDPPPLQEVSPTRVSEYDNTTNAADQDTYSPVKAERSHYFDAGLTQNVLPGLEVGVDGYYKIATNQIDDGQFGAANISSPYNYAHASLYGAELSGSYSNGGFKAYANFAAADSWAKDIVSSEFEFDSDELAYISTHNVNLDQQQYYTASAGISYSWESTVFHADAIYGDGIRAGFANTEKLNPSYPVNLGIEHQFRWGKVESLTVRFDITNLFDQSYVLNAGTGIGEGAVKYGNRRGFFGGLTYAF